MSGKLVGAAELAESALGGAGPAGRIAIVEERFEAEVRFANNTVTTNGVHRDRAVTVISFDARKNGTAVGVSSSSGPVDISQLKEASANDAKGAQVADDEAELVGGPEGAAGTSDFLDEPATTDLQRLSPVLDSLAGVFERASANKWVAAGFATHKVTTTYLASTTGLRQRFSMPDGRVELVGRADDGSRSSWAGAGTNDFGDVELSLLEAKVEKGLSWSERRIELPAGRYETILPPDAVADLVLMVDAEASGRHAEEGRNVFSAPGGKTKVGERLFSLPFNLSGDPHDPRFETAPFLTTRASGPDVSVFDNGMALKKVALIEQGTLARLRYRSAGAARSPGAGFTPDVGNITLQLPGASTDLEEMVSQTKRGLLLTCLWYIRSVDPATLLLTGLTRDGVFLVENGEVSGVVNNFRFNESPVDMLTRTVEAGRTERALSREWGEWLARSAMPPLRVADFNMSSVSPAT